MNIQLSQLIIYNLQYFFPDIKMSYNQTQEDMYQAIENGDADTVRLLLNDPLVDPAANNNYAIQTASVSGYKEVMRLLLDDPRVDPSADDNVAIKLASKGGNADVMRLLLADPRVDPSKTIVNTSRSGYLEVIRVVLADGRIDLSGLIAMASLYGSTEKVRLLLADPRVDPTEDNNSAIKDASRNGHTEVVRLLLADGRVDPAADDNYAIRWATKNGHTEISKLLLQHGAKPQNKEQERIRHELVRDQMTPFNQLYMHNEGVSKVGGLPSLMMTEIFQKLHPDMSTYDLYSLTSAVTDSVYKTHFQDD